MKQRLSILALVFALIAAACGSGATDGNTNSDTTTTSSEGSGLKIAIAYDLAGRGDGGFNDLAYNGTLEAADELGGDLTEVTAKAEDSDQDRVARLRLLASSGHNPIIAVGFTYASAVAEVAADFPNVWFGIVDDGTVDMPNVVGLVFAEEQGSFLVGVAAALKTETDNIGFIGGTNIPLIRKFQAGYVAGAQAVNPTINIQVTYLSQPPDFSGLNDPAKGKEAAKGMFDAGADIVYHAAGGSGIGLFDAALEDGHLAIGVDADQYELVPEDQRPVVMTSMLKNLNVATYSFVTSVADGTVVSGTEVFDLARGGVGYSRSGGQVDDIAGQLEEFTQKIIDGDIEVPTTTE